MARTAVCTTADVEAGQVRGYTVNLDGQAHKIAVARDADGLWYAIDDRCSHGDVDLSEGEVDGCEIECWAHAGRFDLRTGEATALPALETIRTYPIAVEGTDVFLTY